MKDAWVEEYLKEPHVRAKLHIISLLVRYGVVVSTVLGMLILLFQVLAHS